MSTVSFFYPNESEAFPPQSKLVVILTYILSGLGILIGIILLIISRGSSYFSEGEIDDLPDFGPIFKWVGTIFFVLALVSFGVNLLFVKKRKIGWLFLTGIYISGSILTIYYLYLGIKILIDHRLFALPYPLLVILAIGIIGLYSLFHKNTLRLFFSNAMREIN